MLYNEHTFTTTDICSVCGCSRQDYAEHRWECLKLDAEETDEPLRFPAPDWRDDTARLQRALQALTPNVGSVPPNSAMFDIQFSLERDIPAPAQEADNREAIYRDIVPHLVRLLTADQDSSQFQAAELLGKLGTRAAVSTVQILEAARHPDCFVRGQILRSLAAIAPMDQRSIEEALDDAGDSEEAVRAAAYFLLGHTSRGDDPRIVNACLQGLQDRLAAVRENAAIAIGKLSIRAADELTPLLADRSKYVRAAAKTAIDTLRGSPGDAHSDAASLLGIYREMLRSKNAHDRAAGCDALGALGLDAAPALKALVPLLADPRPTVVYAAANAISAIGSGDAECIAELVRLVRDAAHPAHLGALTCLECSGYRGAELSGLMEGILHDLGHPGRAVAARILVGVEGHDIQLAPLASRLVHDDDPEVVTIGLTTLRGCDNAVATKIDAGLTGLQSASCSVRCCALYLLKSVGKNAALTFGTVLSCMIEDTDFAVRYNAAGVLLAFGPPPVQYVPVLMDALHHVDEDVVASAAALLAESGASALPALPELSRLAQDRTRMSSSEAREAIIKLMGPEYFRSHPELFSV